jgi:hypothetical protein
MFNCFISTDSVRLIAGQLWSRVYKRLRYLASTKAATGYRVFVTYAQLKQYNPRSWPEDQATVLNTPRSLRNAGKPFFALRANARPEYQTHGIAKSSQF